MKTIVLAHYYTTTGVQGMADYVGDSLELAQRARDAKADRIVFAGVRFMAETAKLLNPEAEVILVDSKASCSLVKETPIEELLPWLSKYPDHVHVSYINSSIQHKAVTDVIVTSRNARDIISKIIDSGKKVVFSPDYNMGHYLNVSQGWDMPLWKATCEVHKQFDTSSLDPSRHWIVSHPEANLEVLQESRFVGSTKEILEWVDAVEKGREIPIYIATEEGIITMLKNLRPDLNINQVPISENYKKFRPKKCECAECPYMKLNTTEKVYRAIRGYGERIVIDPSLKELALKPINAMLNDYN